MSSHHIVREDQEPALLILDATFVSQESFQQLLEWSPTIIACEAAIEELLSHGIKIDVAILSKTSSLTEQLQDQTPIQFRFIDSNNFLQEGLTFATIKNYKTINCILSDFESLDYLSEEKSEFEIVAFSNSVRWSLIRKGSFVKWYSRGIQLLVHPKVNIATEGLTDALLTKNSGLIKISSANNFWVGEQI